MIGRLILIILVLLLVSYIKRISDTLDEIKEEMKSNNSLMEEE